MYAALATAWNLIGGYGGYLSFGHAAFFGIGAYTSALLMGRYNLSPFVTWPAGAVAAMAFAAACGYPALRLRGPYFAVTTLILALAAHTVVANVGFTGGGSGLWLAVPPWSPLVTRALFYGFVLVVLVATLGLARRFEAGRQGLELAALRSDEEAAQALGFNTPRVKLVAFAVSAGVTGAVGSVYIFDRVYLYPESVFDTNLSVMLVLMALFGGRKRWFGPAVGAGVVRGLEEALTVWIGAEAARIAFGLLLAVIIVLLPEGLAGLAASRRAPGRTRLLEDRGEPPEGFGTSPSRDRLSSMVRSEPAALPAKALRSVGGRETMGPGMANEPGAANLRVEGVMKRFGGLQVLNGVSFEVRKGEILGLIGPNGAGKTTLFNLITGLQRPTQGQVSLEGRPLTGLPPYAIARRGVGRTFQIPRPFSELHTTDNVTAVLIAREPTVGRMEDVRAQARRLLVEVGLGHRVDAPVGVLTVQEKKRLELARALAVEPQVLLLDEIFAGLNPVETMELTQLLERINRERGLAMVLVEHVLQAVMRLSHRVVVLAYGDVIAEGTPAEILENAEVRRVYLGWDYDAVAG
ncbi:branched-chain amino acid ABC transporter ATP-binding protein/permease [Carboxydochorda subterranea]|uniref:Branched-chain amino acid ABC transporter ATP-binding protein/permease n=1 Tax=Carboxydichorda subterranea TaxID=3109565 RepID=A0ABZ1BX60_9FIRM|nr:branched-chain amino acid ABC transporter ATP-binding protein/permease [Limnochorda sp. L945t]WRP17395.1 branched-chain amino acid ABC transporter ATP-binding protein/permease [Limnochorda sp. L945t]